MPQIEIYTKDYCPYCQAAKALLRDKGTDYSEISLTENPERLGEMIVRAQGRKTVPQIFVEGAPVGGFDDISLLDERGELDRMLGMMRAE